jgi:hypothetical protein
MADLAPNRIESLSDSAEDSPHEPRSGRKAQPRPAPREELRPALPLDDKDDAHKLDEMA